jgi:hypothetical protein
VSDGALHGGAMGRMRRLPGRLGARHVRGDTRLLSKNTHDECAFACEAITSTHYMGMGV